MNMSKAAQMVMGGRDPILVFINKKEFFIGSVHFFDFTGKLNSRYYQCFSSCFTQCNFSWQCRVLLCVCAV